MKPLLKLGIYFKPYRKQFSIVILLGIVMGITTTSVIPLVQTLFDDVIQRKDEALLWKVPLGIVALYGINGIARFFHLFILKMVGERIAAQIRKDLQEKFMTLNLSFHNSYHAGSGGLLSRTLNDVTIVQWGVQIFADMVREPLTALLLLGWLIHLDWKLALFSLTIAPVLFIALKQLARSLRKYAHNQQETLEDFTSTLKETLDGVRVIQSFQLESEMKGRLQKVVDRYLGSRRKIIMREEAAGPISEFFAATFLAAVVLYMATEIFKGTSTAGTFLAFLTALIQFQLPVKKIQDAYIRIQQTVTAVERLFEILDDTNVVPQTGGSQPFPKQWQEVQFKNVSFGYDSGIVLRNVNLTVKRGDVIAFVGESGSGKSTLVNLVERFFDPTEGEILVGGLPIQKMDLKDLRKNIALVTQDVFLFNDTIQMNIRAGDLTRDPKQVELCAKASNAHDFIIKTPKGYETIVGDRGARLSGGERQRISIARALYKDSPILILDEATSALDSASEVEVQKGLDRLMEGRTTFVIAHRLSTVSKATRIFVLKSGQIVEQGTHKELMAANGTYSQFVNLQTVQLPNE